MDTKDTSHKIYPSSEILNAFLDGELCVEDRREIHEILAHDDALKKEACELHRIKQLLKEAYPEPVAERSDNISAPLRRAHRAWPFAASVVLGVAATMTWSVVSQQSVPQTVAHAPQQRDERPATPVVNAKRIMFHLKSTDRESIDDMFREVEYLMGQSKSLGEDYEVRIVAHGDGLNLLRADTSPYPELIKDMKVRYKNVTFAACFNTIERLRQEQGIIVELLPEAIVIDSGVAEVIRRQQNGWVYIRV